MKKKTRETERTKN